ncbi:hypothetical protein V2J09_012645 [Rumex salicifolius]
MLATLSLSAPHFPPNSNSSFSSLPKSFSPQTPNSLPCTTNDTSSFLQCRKDGEEPRIKMPTAPWMKGPLLLTPGEVLHLSNPTTKPPKKNSSRDPDRFLTQKVPGRMGKKAAKEISNNIEKLHRDSDSEQDQPIPGKIGSGLFIKQVAGDWDTSMERARRRLPWVSEDKEMVFLRSKTEKVRTAAELSMDKELLYSLRGEARKMRIWVKVNKAGFTEAVVDEMHSVWSSNELVMLRIGLPLCLNMDRAREIAEFKTGGLVVWSKKDKLVVYRGSDYEERQPQNLAGSRKPSKLANSNKELKSNSSSEGEADEEDLVGGYMMPYGLSIDGEACQVHIDGSLYEREGDRLLEGLGPRFVDWWYPKPLPVDADLLPEVVRGFKTPFRRRPPNMRPKLTDDELTYLRKFALYLPTHFGGTVDSRRLTGGVLLLRNKFFIILYRGKDFLSVDVASLVVEREMELRKLQLFEEDMRHNATTKALSSIEEPSVSSTAGTLSEFHVIQEICGQSELADSEADIQYLAGKDKLQKLLRRKEFKLATLIRKIGRTTKELSKLNSKWNPSEDEPDQELMTVEERECLKKVGLKMSGVLVLGRRGVFGGVIEGMHQHWKHREVVKVINKQRSYTEVIFTARMLERESGGILVSVDKHKEVYTIIIYRGKNYRRPVRLGSNLLDKRKALQRSLEMQRLGSLNFFAYQREKEITDLKLRLEDLERKRLAL